MSDEQLLHLMITRAEASTLLIGLAEYLYLVEEGNIDEVLEELERDDDDDEPVDAEGAAELAARIEALLS